MGGQTQLFFTALTQSSPHLRTGKLRILAVTEAKRADVLPDVPTLGETLPAYELVVWYGVFGPAGMPRELSTRLNGEVNRIMALPDVAERLGKIGIVPMPLSVQQFTDLARRDHDKWTKVIREMGIVAEP